MTESIGSFRELKVYRAAFELQQEILGLTGSLMVGSVSPSSVFRPPPSVVRHLFSVLCPLSSVICLLSSVLRPLSSVICPPSSALRHLSSVLSVWTWLNRSIKALELLD